MGQLLQQKNYGNWEYTSKDTAKEEAGFQTTEEYIRQQQNMFTQYIDMPSLLDLCEGSERSLGERVGIRWWEQTGINMAGKREATEEAEVEEDRGEE